MSKTRELIISPKVNQAQLTKFLPQLEEEGIKTLYYTRTESVLRGDIANQAMNPDCIACDGRIDASHGHAPLGVVGACAA